MYLVVTIIDTFYSSFLWLYIDTQKKASLNFVHGVLQGQTAPHSHPCNIDCNIDLSPHGIIQSLSSPLLKKYLKYITSHQETIWNTQTLII